MSFFIRIEEFIKLKWNMNYIVVIFLIEEELCYECKGY